MTKAAFDRLRKEFARLLKAPPQYIEAVPLESNILEWHYVITGPPDSPYDGGLYTGKLVFPPQYPFKPPSILMTTPSGRFQTNTRLCLSISDFHPETWNPLWSVSSILSGLLSFMLETTPTLGSIESSDQTKREYAARSLEFNLKLPVFRKLFPQYVKRAAEAQNSAADDSAAADAEAASDDTKSAASLTQRRAATADSSTNSLPLRNDIAVPNLDPLPPKVITVLGVSIQERAVFDLMVMLVVLATVIFAIVFMSSK
jgi:ubiquitin-conjugating enzyme E2 J2